MEKLNKLLLNPEKLLTKEDLLFLRGGSACGEGIQEWYCGVSYYGTYLFGGIACGSEAYIRSVCNSYGYTCSCSGGQRWYDMPI
jgi:hypothetical protein